MWSHHNLADTLCLFLALFTQAFSYDPSSQVPFTKANTVDDLPHHIREFWMREAIVALETLVSPCAFQAFGTVIVNHTAPDHARGNEYGTPICIGANALLATGNPTLHGEIAAINNCTSVLTDPYGSYRLSPSEAAAAYSDLTLYTTAEPCPMCASAIRWAGFRECIFGTGLSTLAKLGWSQIDMPSEHLFRHARSLGTETGLLGDVLTNETDPLFMWQYDEARQCPKGCEREDGFCAPTM